ncbi:hypothetical protein AHAS_Ahas17G0234300 [Arachis hypogaea]
MRGRIERGRIRQRLGPTAMQILLCLRQIEWQVEDETYIMELTNNMYNHGYTNYKTKNFYLNKK